MNYKEFTHIKLNGKSFSKNEILDLTFSGESHLDDVFQFLQFWFNNEEEIIVQTSGSTGNPKKISIPKQSFVESAKNTCEYLNLNSKTKALLCIPVKYIGGKMMVVRALFCGYDLIVQEPNSNPLKELKEIEFIAITPMQAQNSFTEFPEKLESIKTIIIGGGSVSDSFCKVIGDFSNSMYSTYGMTETVSHIALRKLTGKDKSDLYEVLPNYSISQNEEDCLVIDCPSLSKERIITNDMVELESKNRFKWIGRKDNVINSGGIKLSPEIIEKKIANYIPKDVFYITSKKDKTLGEEVTLIILAEESNWLLNTNWEADLSKFEVPKSVILEKEFNYTKTGKIIRKKY